jgi:biotin carboxyl carrier protein
MQRVAVGYNRRVKRELVVTTDQHERAVVVEGPLPDGRFRIVIDGTERLVDARALRPGTWSLIIDGRSFLVDLDRRRAGIAASVGASEAMLQVEDARQRKRAAAAAAGRGAPARGESIRAPIAGKVIKALVAVGDTVAAGQPVFVLEAMKMENELVAERGGTVSAIHKQPGQAVDTGDLLVELT